MGKGKDAAKMRSKDGARMKGGWKRIRWGWSEDEVKMEKE